MAYTVKVCDPAGAVSATLTNAQVTERRVELNGHGGGRFVLPIEDAQATPATIKPLRDEVQIWDGAELVDWWLVWDCSIDGQGNLEFICEGAASVLWARHFGDADRTNYLPNPGAESGTTGWAATDCTMTQSSDRASEGTYSFKLVATDYDLRAYM